MAFEFSKKHGFEPMVSIVIPVYNGSKYLAEAIDSALAQSYSNIDVVVVNDGSKDNGATREVALSYGDKIRYFEKENGGSSSALNMGIANMRGEYFSWLSHDDLYAPEKVETQIQYLEHLQLSPEELSKQILFSACDLIDKDSKIIRHTPKEERIKKLRLIEALPGNEYLIAEPTKYTFHGCSCLIHKNVFEVIGCFDEGLRLLNDLDLWFRIYSSDYKIHYLPEALVKGRIHAAQVSRSIGFSYHNSEQDMFWKRSFEWLMLHHSKNPQLFFLFGRNAYLKTRNDDGDRSFAYLVSIKPSQRVKLFFLKPVYKSRATIRTLIKKVCLKLKT